MPNVAPCNFMGKAVRSLLEIFDPEDEGIILPRNVGNYLPVDLTKQPRRSECIKHVLKILLSPAARNFA